MGKLYWHDGRAYTEHQSSARGKKRYGYYVSPVTPDEKAQGVPPFTISTDELHQSVTHHLRHHFREPESLLPNLIALAGSGPFAGQSANAQGPQAVGPGLGAADQLLDRSLPVALD